jgi:hypothetical protein
MAEERNVVDLAKLKNNVFDYVRFRLGDQMVEVELDPEHYENAIVRAVEVFRTRSQAAVEESFVFLKPQKDVQIYTLPEEIQYVQKIWRRSIGDLGTGGSNFDPFSQGYLNTYILNAGRSGGLLSFELYSDFQFQASRMFGGEIDFNFNSVTKKLSLIRRPLCEDETMLLQTYNLRPLVQLLTDYRTLTFLKEYTYALCLSELGQAREKYSTIVGPGGGTTLNGASLKAEATAIMTELHMDIQNYRFGERPLGLLIG